MLHLLFPPQSALRKETRYRGPRPPLTPRHLLRPLAFSTLPGLQCAYHLSLRERSFFRNNWPVNVPFPSSESPGKLSSPNTLVRLKISLWAQR
jgi:hypothetical protein